jgi:hypothetical protein
MKPIALLSLILLTSCSNIHFNQKETYYNKEGRITKRLDIKYDKDGYCPQWSPGKTISFENHNF